VPGVCILCAFFALSVFKFNLAAAQLVHVIN